MDLYKEKMVIYKQNEFSLSLSKKRERERKKEKESYQFLYSDQKIVFIITNRESFSAFSGRGFRNFL